MAGALTFIELDNANKTTVQAQLYNTLPIAGGVTGNRPVTAITVLDDGRMVAGTYYITFSSVVPGLSGVAVVSAADSNNPWVTNATLAILDDSQTSSGTGTRHNNIIGGLGLYFSNSGSFATSWTATILIGGYFASGTATPVSTFGVLNAGATSSQKKIGVQNTGDADCTGCVLGIYPGTYFKNTTGTPISKVKVISKSATVGKYALTFSNFNSVPSPDQIDVYASRYSYNYTTNVWDLVSGSTYKGTFGITGTSTYTTIISETEVTLSQSITGNGGAASVYIESTSGAQVAPDVTGTPGSWVTASDIVLTENGGGTSGLIQPTNVAHFWLRVNSSGSDKPGNLRKFILRPSGTSVGDLVE
jgi:hypothetical protein